MQSPIERQATLFFFWAGMLFLFVGLYIAGVPFGAIWFLLLSVFCFVATGRRISTLD